MNSIIPLEFENQRIMTTRVLAEQFGTDEKNIQVNYSRNQSRFTEGKHFFRLEGEDLKNFKKSLPTISREPLKFASQLILWTDRGAARHAKILDTDEAWEIYEKLEENYFKTYEKKPECMEDIMIHSLEIIKQMRRQLDENRQKTNEVEEEIKEMREVIEIKPSDNWRSETNTLINKICFKLRDYSSPKDEAYRALEERGACDLKIRLKNMKSRYLLKGGCKSKADNLNMLDVIAEDKRLIEIYTAIVKDMALKYKT